VEDGVLGELARVVAVHGVSFVAWPVELVSMP
jgi:hypothetical protein